MVVVIDSMIFSSSTKEDLSSFSLIYLRFFFVRREQMRMYQQMHVLKHLSVAASREENYPVSV